MLQYAPIHRPNQFLYLFHRVAKQGLPHWTLSKLDLALHNYDFSVTVSKLDLALHNYEFSVTISV